MQGWPKPAPQRRHVAATGRATNLAAQCARQAARSPTGEPEALGGRYAPTGTRERRVPSGSATPPRGLTLPAEAPHHLGA